MSEEERGLYAKYHVTHADGSPVDGFCFVLRPDRDPAAWHALLAYACMTPNLALYADLKNVLDDIGQPPPE